MTRVPLLWVAFALLLGLETPEVRSQEAIPEPLKNNRLLLPEEGDWQRLIEGTEKAETLRRKWLRTLPTGASAASELGALMAVFESVVAREIPEPRPSLVRFDWEPLDLESRFRGDIGLLSHGSGFAEFTGKWYGSWDGMEVNHDWSPTRPMDPAWGLPNGRYPLRVDELQYAWIGDGFGWNILTRPNEGRSEKVILGAVFHSSVEQPRQVHTFRPHVGVRPGARQLIWITEKEVFYEEALEDGERYAITGFFMDFDRNGSPRFRAPGFQAVYSRTDGVREPFFRFPLPVPE